MSQFSSDIATIVQLRRIANCPTRYEWHLLHKQVTSLRGGQALVVK